MIFLTICFISACDSGNLVFPLLYSVWLCCITVWIWFVERNVNILNFAVAAVKQSGFVVAVVVFSTSSLSSSDTCGVEFPAVSHET